MYFSQSDIIYIGLAIAMAALSFRGHRLLCFVIISNMIACHLINYGLLLEYPEPDKLLFPWYFFGYAIVDVVYIAILALNIVSMASKVACYIFLASMGFNFVVFLEKYQTTMTDMANESTLYYDHYEIYMSGICISLILTMAWNGKIGNICRESMDVYSHWLNNRRDMASTAANRLSISSPGAPK